MQAFLSPQLTEDERLDSLDHFGNRFETLEQQTELLKHQSQAQLTAASGFHGLIGVGLQIRPNS